MEKEIRRRKAVIIDIDGSLADVSSGLHFIVGKPKHERDHDAFIAMSDSYPANQQALDWIRPYAEAGYALIVLTGREERYRAASEAWVRQAMPWPWEVFKMSPNHDPRPGEETKRELYQELVDEGYEIVGAIEDRPRIIALWEELGIPDIEWVQGDNDPARDEARV